MPKSPPRVEYSPGFKKQLRRAPVKIQEVFRKRRELFVIDSFHPLLRNHSLSGKWHGCRSINVTGDWRAIFSQEYLAGQSKTTVLFLVIGTHSQLYH